MVVFIMKTSIRFTIKTYVPKNYFTSQTISYIFTGTLLIMGVVEILIVTVDFQIWALLLISVPENILVIAVQAAAVQYITDGNSDDWSTLVMVAFDTMGSIVVLESYHRIIVISVNTTAAVLINLGLNYDTIKEYYDSDRRSLVINELQNDNDLRLRLQMDYFEHI